MALDPALGSLPAEPLTIGAAMAEGPLSLPATLSI